MSKKPSSSRAPAAETTLRCAEVMRRRVVSVEPGNSVMLAARLMHENGCGLLPVVDHEQRVVGVISDRDIVIRVCVQAAPESVRVDAAMSREVVSCRPEDPLSVAEELMIAHRKSRVVVLEDGRLAGVLSLADIAQVEQPLKLARLVREISAREIRIERP
ncbi:MAG TPA: CBS domain-containing protein [Polyangiaceae bacterium]